MKRQIGTRGPRWERPRWEGDKDLGQEGKQEQKLEGVHEVKGMKEVILS